MSNTTKQSFQQLLKPAGITFNGPKSYDPQVHNDAAYERILKHGSLGAGESYMDGWWDVDDLEELVYRLFTANLYKGLTTNWRLAAFAAKGFVANLQTKGKASKNARHHYDIGNDLYEPMLGPTMAYSCAYWAKGAKNLEQAQETKYELICQKLQLKKDMQVLDIGAGWGGLARYMVDKYGVTVTALTPALEQVAFMKSLHNKKIIPIEIIFQDFEPKQQFDRIVSVGMFEHVGPKNYPLFFKKCDEWLKKDGLFLLHSIHGSGPAHNGDPWMDKYIFPGGVLPALEQVAKISRKYFTTEDIQNFGPDYEKTLLAWYKNFQKAYPKLDHSKYDERFKRMWEFYLLICAAEFKARQIHLLQYVFTKKRSGTYVAAR